MLLINQDRDVAMMFNDREQAITAHLVYIKGEFIAVNLMLDDVLLGTFDSLEEALIERGNIMECPYHIWYVSGYSEWEEI